MCGRRWISCACDRWFNERRLANRQCLCVYVCVYVCVSLVVCVDPLPAFALRFCVALLHLCMACHYLYTSMCPPVGGGRGLRWSVPALVNTVVHWCSDIACHHRVDLCVGWPDLVASVYTLSSDYTYAATLSTASALTACHAGQVMPYYWAVISCETVHSFTYAAEMQLHSSHCSW